MGGRKERLANRRRVQLATRVRNSSRKAKARVRREIRRSAKADAKA